MSAVASGPRPARAFSIAEMLIALAITGMLLAATLSALDASFKSYKNTTETASTHVVARIVMHRIMTMVRTGAEFGPYPDDPLDPAQNPITSDFIEFQISGEPGADDRGVVRIERRPAPVGSQSPWELWYTRTDFVAGAVTSVEDRPLSRGVVDARFTLDYDVGPRLRRATVDLTLRPDSEQGDAIGGRLDTQTLRFVSSVAPRRLN